MEKKMNTKQILFLVCSVMIFSIAFSSCGPKAASPALSAALSELEGTVALKQPGSEEFIEATADSALEENGQVQTGEDGRVRLDLSTGTIVRMAPSSLFTLVSNEETEDGLATKLQLETGKIFIILSGGTMDVETPSGVASVRGSYMSVWVDPETFNVYVTCLEGSCHAGNEAGEVDFSDGEKTILFLRNPDGTYTVPEVEDMTEEDFEEWLDENPEAKDLFEQAVNTMTAMAPTSTPRPTATDRPTITPVPSDTPKPTAEPTKRKLNPDGDQPACTVEDAQWSSPSEPCYCDEGSQENPPYCYGEA
jgi:hypothetical protein